VLPSDRFPEMTKIAALDATLDAMQRQSPSRGRLRLAIARAEAASHAKSIS